MAANADQGRARLKPPRLAHSLLTLFVARADHAALIGDLEEEFTFLTEQSPQAAKNWYWRQTAQSLPHLIRTRLQSSGARKITTGLMVFVILFFLIGYWDIWISRNAARGFYAIFNPETYAPARIAFLGTQILGICFAGAIIAFTVFERQHSLWKNARRYLPPAALIILAPTLYDLFISEGGYDNSMLIARIGLTMPALFMGAALVIRFLSSNSR